MHDSPQIAQQAAEAGASACLLKSDAASDLQRVVAGLLKSDPAARGDGKAANPPAARL
jgi:hypothetical protein